jgi:hypothetical protein
MWMVIAFPASAVKSLRRKRDRNGCTESWPIAADSVMCPPPASAITSANSLLNHLSGEAEQMRTIRGNHIFTAIVLALVGGSILVATHNGFAQERKRISWSVKAENTKITVQQALEIPDIPSHLIRITEFRRTWPGGTAPTVEGQKVVEEIVRGFADSIAGNGRGWGYSLWRFESGDQMFSEYQNTIQTIVSADKSRKTTFVGTYVTTGATGKIKGIKGLGRFAGVAELDAEGKAIRNEYSAEGEYWLEK